MFVGPKRRKQDELAGLRRDRDVLIAKFRLLARAWHVVQIPNRHQLPVAEYVTAAVDLPVVVLAGVGALNGELVSDLNHQQHINGSNFSI